ncbi:phage tail tube protein [Nitratidesulfovibrio sp. SRB-5]|uniref:phage tail tube protein n=1 Tax=Nitratidesulfovibrio sp. SRB-5 TaxID=2872636 RepID=UPI000E2F937D|nr:phage tail tube protein [Nitratidesulfovibrio sp. SRB-5]MBZ2172192.1 phage tail protein [Nitratidesulfovibrio sp. SRB-5]RXF77388.1 hypothetical protein EKK70_06985 [Desulfovibrio sp. DS-1]GBO96882.1 hypothetical protein RVX_1921 [Nitratidesulfovibrio sp. HK-II]GBO98278.1 hypothetical protein RVX_3317 [Nitratidesulfovibrio sp. HK-II]
MAKKYTLSKGSVLKLGDGAEPEVFTTLPGLTKLSIDGISKDDIDVTDLESDGKEYAPGLADYGSFSAEGIWDDTNAQHLALLDLLGSGEVQNWQVVTSAGTKWGFSGYVKSLPLNWETNNVQRFSLTIKVSGKVTRLAA